MARHMEQQHLPHMIRPESCNTVALYPSPRYSLALQVHGEAVLTGLAELVEHWPRQGSGATAGGQSSSPEHAPLLSDLLATLFRVVQWGAMRCVGCCAASCTQCVLHGYMPLCG